jgi:hypothetical protein
MNWSLALKMKLREEVHLRGEDFVDEEAAGRRLTTLTLFKDTFYFVEALCGGVSASVSGTAEGI